MKEYYEGSLSECRAALARIDKGLGLRPPNTTSLIFPVFKTRPQLYTFVIKSTNQRSKLDKAEQRKVKNVRPTVADNARPV